MAGIAYRGLSGLLDARGQVRAQSEKWRALELFFARFEQDLQAVVPRPIRDTGGLILPALMSGEQAASEAQVEFTRMSMAGELGNTRRVGYRLKHNKLEFLIWPVLDRAPRTEPQVLEMLPDVAAFTLRYLDDKGVWRESWRREPTSLPKAVEVQLTLSTQERLQRILILR